jgi:glycerophosphoryl diester phosphodiesterase
MDDGPLKDKLSECKEGPFRRTDFSIGHRGAALQFPEHSKEAYEAGARMGAGIVECDTTFTADGELVCRHAECDLHTTTNIVATPLNARCSVPWSGPGSSPKCCTSDPTFGHARVGLMQARWREATLRDDQLTADGPTRAAVRTRMSSALSADGVAPRPGQTSGLARAEP